MNRRAHRRGHGRPRIATPAAAWLAILCLTALLGCAGGSGSSGFDAVENAAIDEAIGEQRCVESDGLVICPADTTAGGEPTPRPTATVTPPPPTTTSTPTQPTAAETPPVDTPATKTARVATPTQPPPVATATPTITRRATATETPAGMRIDVGLDGSAAIDCMLSGSSCGFSFSFTAVGFPSGTSFLVAARRLPDGLWEITVPFAHFPTGEAQDFDVLIVVPAVEPGETTTVQVAVLAQSAPVDNAPASVDFLGESAAEFAYVTPGLDLRPVP